MRASEIITEIPNRRWEDETPRDPDTIDMFKDYNRYVDPQAIGPLNNKHMLRMIRKLWNGKTGPKGSNIRRGHRRLVDIGSGGIILQKSYGGKLLLPFDGRNKVRWKLLKRQDGRWYLIDAPLFRTVKKNNESV